MFLWYLKVDLEQTQRLVEREEGLSLAHKFNCSFYETSAAHRCAYISLSILIRKKEIPPSPIPHWFFSGATWTMCSTPLSERLGSATRRENSKKTKRRVGKKFGTIFSKQSSGEGGRFEKILFGYLTFSHLQRSKFCIFQLFRWLRFPASKLYQTMMSLFWTSQRLYLKSVPKRWNFLSFKNAVEAFFIHVTLKCILDLFAPHSSFIETALWETVTLYAMFHSRVNFSFKGASKTNILLYLLNVTNIIDITSQAHFLIYHRKHTLWENAKL